MDIRNIAIIAHVDHGKTTLVDGLLQQAGAFREGAIIVERVMDSNDQERERGITILSKNTSVTWGDTRINIVDTPGHADFGSEVERVLRMVDAVLLLVDAVEGPMPQTRFVLRKSLELGHKVLVCINKIDRKDSRCDDVLNEIFDLFVSLNATDEQLDFPVVYAAGRDGYAIDHLGDEPKDLHPLFKLIIDHTPVPPGDPSAPLRLQVATLDYSEFLGRIAIGRVFEGTIERGMSAIVCKREDGGLESFRVTKLMRFEGLERVDTERAEAGEIVALAGAGSATVGDTICPKDKPDPMRAIPIDPPTVSMTFLPNTSPFAESESQFVTSRQIRDRLEREAIANVGLKIKEGATREAFIVSGRGTLHLSVLIESMRREGYAVALSRPQVILKEVDGETHEPFEDALVTCDEAHSGSIIQKLSRRGGEMADLRIENGEARIRWTIPSRGLIGYRSEFLTDTRGTGTLYHVFSHYAKQRSHRRHRPNGAMIVLEDGQTTGYSLFNLQERGQLFVGPGTRVYSGQIIGYHARDNDIVVNPCKGKKLTNIRASGSDEGIILTPPRQFTLEEAIEGIAEDELVEVTPKSIRLRKRIRAHGDRRRDERLAKTT